MALIFADSFDHYATADILDKWDDQTGSGAAITSSIGQGATAGLRMASISHQYIKYITETQNFIVGFWLKLAASSTNTSEIFNLSATGTNLISLRFVSGFIQLHNQSTTLAVAPIFIRGGDEYYIEFKINIHPETGSSILKINGNTMWDITSVNTLISGSVLPNRFRLGTQGSIGTTVDFDDFYICDNTGSYNNDFLGPGRIEALFPSGAGTNAEWTPSTGGNSACVDENPPNDDTDYISSSTVGNLDTYAFNNLSTTSGAVKAVQLNAYTKKTLTGSRQISFATKSGATTSSSQNPTSFISSYKYKRGVFETDPDTSIAWTVSGVNAAEFGVKLYS